MGDCSKTEVFFKEWRRMCDEAEGLRTCLLIQKGITAGCAHCEENVRKNSDEAIKIVQEWSDQHPVRTRSSVFLEVFPYAKRNPENIPTICAEEIFPLVCGCERHCRYEQCVDCWNTPIEESENNG